MQNIVELRDKLIGVFNGLGDQSVDVKTASEQNNAAGKILDTVKVQLAYAALRQEKPNIGFMGEGKPQKRLAKAV